MKLQKTYYFEQGLSLEVIMPFNGRLMTFIDQIVILLTFIDSSAVINLLL